MFCFQRSTSKLFFSPMLLNLQVGRLPRDCFVWVLVGIGSGSSSAPPFGTKLRGIAAKAVPRFRLPWFQLVRS